MRHALPVQRDSTTLDAMDGQRGVRTLVGARLAVFPLLLTLAGCSFAMVRPTPHVNPATGNQECAGVGYAAFDAVGAGIAALTTLAIPVSVAFHNGYGRAFCDSNCPPAESATPSVWIAGGVAGVLAASSIYGFLATDHCWSALGAGRAENERALDEALREAPRNRQTETSRVEPQAGLTPAR